MIRLIYNLLWPVGLLLFLPGYLAKMFRRGGYRRNFGQRLGFYSAESRERLRGKHPTWIHAVSVGEIVIGLKLAEELRALRPDLKCVLTTTTTTGHALAEKTAPEWMRVLYAPLDFWPVMRRAFRVIAPQRIVLIEAEVWPNLVAEAKKRAIPVMLANARLSPRSERRFRRFRFFVTPTFRQLDLVCVPATEDAEQWKNLGVKPPQIHAVGNIKYDASNRRHSSGDVQRLIKTAIETTRSILFGGSTHRGEEKILIDVFCALQSEFPNLFLVLAPRHVERASEIEADLRGRNLRSIRRSAAGKSTERSDCLIFGPHMENFASLAKGLIEAGGAVCVGNSQKLTEESRHLLRDATAREQLVTNALRVIQPHREAAVRTAALIEKISTRGQV